MHRSESISTRDRDALARRSPFNFALTGGCLDHILLMSTIITSRNISRACQTSALLVRLYPLKPALQFSLPPALSQHCLRDWAFGSVDCGLEPCVNESLWLCYR